MILTDINLENISMHGLIEGNAELKKVADDPRNAIAEYLIRRIYNLNLSTDLHPILLSDQAKKISLQRKFEQTLPINFKDIITPLDLTAYHAFHKTN
jgi:hypothetical protein